MEASLTCSTATEPIVLTTLVNGKVVASSKLAPPGPPGEDKAEGEEVQHQHSLVVLSEEEVGSEVKKREEQERRVEEGSVDAE